MRLIASAALVLALAACGPSPPQNAPQPPAPAAAAPDPAEMRARIAALPAPYNAADYDAGRREFAQCGSCHTVAAGAPNRQGPNLHGLFGREAGGLPGFNYSRALQDANFTWDAERLDHWLANPREFLPGNRMAFVGVRDETRRRDVIAYLMAVTAEE